VSDLVSVIIPAFDAAKYIGEAIDSVARQTHEQVEIIVVDDGSTDDTAEVAAHFERAVRYVRQRRSGAAAARNHGVRVSEGRYLAFLDADDLWEPDKLAIQLAAFDADSGLDIVFGHVVQFWSPELAPPAAESVRDLGSPMCGHIPGAMLVTRSAFEEIGPFSEDQELGDFIDWYARALDCGSNITTLPTVVMRRRLHDTNLGRVSTSGPEEYARVLRRVVDRRRRRGLC